MMRYRRALAIAALSAGLAPSAANAQTGSSAAGDAAGATALVGGLGLFVVMVMFQILVFATILAGIVLWVLALVDVVQRNEWEFPNALEGRPTGNDKVMWLLIVLLVGVIGGAVYYFTIMKKYSLKRIRAGGVSAPQPPATEPPAPPQPYAPQPPAPPQPYAPQPPAQGPPIA